MSKLLMIHGQEYRRLEEDDQVDFTTIAHKRTAVCTSFFLQICVRVTLCTTRLLLRLRYQLCVLWTVGVECLSKAHIVNIWKSIHVSFSEQCFLTQFYRSSTIRSSFFTLHRGAADATDISSSHTNHAKPANRANPPRNQRPRPVTSTLSLLHIRVCVALTDCIHRRIALSSLSPLSSAHEE